MATNPAKRGALRALSLFATLLLAGALLTGTAGAAPLGATDCDAAGGTWYVLYNAYTGTTTLFCLLPGDPDPWYWNVVLDALVPTVVSVLGHGADVPYDSQLDPVAQHVRPLADAIPTGCHLDARLHEGPGILVCVS